MRSMSKSNLGSIIRKVCPYLLILNSVTLTATLLSRISTLLATKKPKRPFRSNNSSLRPSLTSAGESDEESEECVMVELEK
jgi:hypothetical protein